MVLEFYYDLKSQPCRAVYLFLKSAGVKFEAKVLDLTKGEHRSEEFLKKNPYHKVPIIVDDGFVLAESVAIMRYIATKYKMADHWYPRTDIQAQARVDEFLNWQHLCLRKPEVELFLTLFRTRISFGPFTKVPADPAKVSELGQEVTRAINHISDYFLKDRPFLAGDEISAADIIGVNELIHLEAVNKQETYETNANVKAWIHRVETRLQPHFQDARRNGLSVIGKMWKDAEEFETTHV